MPPPGKQPEKIPGGTKNCLGRRTKRRHSLHHHRLHEKIISWRCCLCNSRRHGQVRVWLKMTCAFPKPYASPAQKCGSGACPWLEQAAAVRALAPSLPAFAQGCRDKILRAAKEGGRLPHFAGLDPAIHAFGYPKQRRGCADQIRARRPQMVSGEPRTSHPRRENFPGQPCAFAGMTRNLRAKHNSFRVRL